MKAKNLLKSIFKTAALLLIYGNVSAQCGTYIGSFSATPTSSCGLVNIDTYSSQSGLTYNWDFGDGTYSNSSSSSINHQYPTVDHTYTVTLNTYSNSTVPCATFTNVAIVNNCTLPPPTPTCTADASFIVVSDLTSPGDYIIYESTSGSGTLSYLWSFGDGSTSSQLYFGNHQYSAPGPYNLCLTVTSTTGTLSCSNTHCDSTSIQKIAPEFLMKKVKILPKTTGIDEINSLVNTNVYPNPMTDELSIEVSVKDHNKLNYVLIDALGRNAVKGMIESGKATVNTANLENGFYFLNIANDNGAVLKTIKLVK